MLKLNLSGHDIKEVYEQQNGKCYFSGESLKIFFRNCEIDENVISIDRIDSNGGYNKNNIRIVSKRFNFFKNCKSDNVFYNECILVILKKLEESPKTEDISITIKTLQSYLLSLSSPTDDIKFKNDMETFTFIEQ
jgi:hypothetical protein